MTHAPHLRAALCVICLRSLQPGTQFLAAAPVPSHSLVQIVELGDFHGSDVHLTKGGTSWVGLFPAGDKLEWRNVALRLKYEHDEVGDDPPNVFTGKRLYLRSPGEPLFLVRGLSGLVGTPVTTSWRKTALLNDPPAGVDPADYGSLEVNKDRTFDLNGIVYTLKVQNPNPGEGGELGVGASLVLSSAGASQTLYSLPKGGNDPSWVLHWAGDLDGDGKLDLYISLSDHYDADNRILFLSSRAADGSMVKAVASFSTIGC